MESTTTGGRARTAKRAAKRAAVSRKQDAAVGGGKQDVAAVADAPKDAGPLKAAALEEFGRRLSGLIAGGPHETRVVTGSDETRDGDNQVSGRGLEIEEISRLLIERESRGYQNGHSAGWLAGRRGVGERVQRERMESVAGTLLFVVRQLTPVAEALAVTEKHPDSEVHRVARLRFVEMLAEMSRHAQRIAEGEEHLAGSEL
jgi:hypothetical protein